MFPTRLNVLPPEKQKILQKMIRNEFIRTNLAITIVVCSIIGISFLIAQNTLETYFSDLADNLTAISSDTQEKNSQIQLVNERIQIAEQIFDGFYYWPDPIIILSGAIPPGVTLSHIEMDLEKNLANITGIADTRESLLLLGERVKAVEFVERVDIPLSHFTEKKNISFSIDITLQ